jgi:hypothetical protein
MSVVVTARQIRKVRSTMNSLCETTLKKYNDLLISDEAALFDGVESLISDIQVLQDIFHGHEIKTILYLRRADDWCKSALRPEAQIGP